MIIQCDNCGARYKLDDSKVKPEGVRVRCTKCQSVFVVTPPEEVEELSSEDILASEKNKAPKGPGAQAPESDAAPSAGESARSAPEGPDRATGEESPQAGERDTGGFDLSFEPGEFGEEDFSSVPEGGEAEEPSTGGEEGGESPAGGFSFDELDFTFSEDRSTDSEEEPETPPESPVSGADTPETSSGGDEDLGGLGPEGFDFGGEASAGEEDTSSGESSPFDELDFSFGDEEDTGGEEDTGDEGPSVAGPPSGNNEDLGFEARKGEHEPREDDEQDGAREVLFGSAPAVEEDERAGEEDNVVPFSPPPGRDEPGAGGVEAEAGEVGDEARSGDFSQTLSAMLSSKEDEEDAGPGPTGGDTDQALPEARSANLGILAAVLAVVLGVGVLYFTGIIDDITTQVMSEAESTQPLTIESVNGYFAENEDLGQVFAIEATVRNTLDEPLDVKGARGVIYGAGGEELASRMVSPGRVVTPEELKTLSGADLERQFSDLSGGRIPPRGTVPVMVVFTEVPAGLAEFGVDVIR